MPRQNGRYESLDLVDLPTIGTDSDGFLGSKAPPGKKRQTSSAMFDPVFGPVGRSPLEKESVLTMQVKLTVTIVLYTLTYKIQ